MNQGLMIWPSPTAPSASNSSDSACISPGRHYPMVLGDSTNHIYVTGSAIDPDNGNILITAYTNPVSSF